MNWWSIFYFVVCPMISIAIVPIVRSYFINIETRLKQIEDQQKYFITESEARMIIADKLDPVKESLDDIKVRIDKLTDYIVKH